MGITVHAPEQYGESLRNLFPRGPYWDRQFADPRSDCSLFVRAKLDGLVRFRTRMSDLQDESMVPSATETLDAWERVLAAAITRGLDPEERRSRLLSRQNAHISRAVIHDIGQVYGLTVTDIVFPFRPAFFGFSRCALDRVSSPAAYAVLFLYGTPDNAVLRRLFEGQFRRAACGFARFGLDRMTSPFARSAVNIYIALEGGINWGPVTTALLDRLLAHYIVHFIFGGA
jgi:uncharacterized protein YmfQ (DUF2313 family)